MPSRTIGITLVTAGLVVAVSGPRVAPRTVVPASVPADTVVVDPIAKVTMEPIRVVMSRDQRLESVTMEPIRVVIPLGEEPESGPEP